MAKRVITEEDRTIAEQMLLSGAAVNAVVEATGISKRTVCSIKKTLPVVATQTAQDENSRAIGSQLKVLAKCTTKIEKEQLLFEDAEEGWVFSVTAQKAQNDSLGRWWRGVVYPESASEDWIDRIRQEGLELAISPLHDKDTWKHDSPAVLDPETGEVMIPAGDRYKAGDRKKPHWHILVKFQLRTGFWEANRLIRSFTNGPYLQKCHSLKGSYEYFIHLNDPDKYQYDKDEIQTFNGFSVEPTEVDKKLMYQEILQWILATKPESMSEVAFHFQTSYEYVSVLGTKTYLLARLVDENWRQAHPEYAKKVEIVEGKKNG